MKSTIPTRMTKKNESEEDDDDDTKKGKGKRRKGLGTFLQKGSAMAVQQNARGIVFSLKRSFHAPPGLR
jgi:hypothetical protein